MYRRCVLKNAPHKRSEQHNLQNSDFNAINRMENSVREISLTDLTRFYY